MVRKEPVHRLCKMVVSLVALVICSCGLWAATHMSSNGIKPLPNPPSPAHGSFDRSIQFGGLKRTYRVYLPSSYDGRQPVALVLAFHGRIGTGRSQERLSHLTEVADRRGFILVYPDGIGRSWNAGHGTGTAARRNVDDIGFVSKLIDDLSQELNINRHRIYATGMSNGAIFVHRLACELSPRIAAIAAIAGTIAPEIAKNCKGGRAVSVMQVHGTADPIVPWEGGFTKGRGHVASVPETIKFWVAHNGCSLTPGITHLGESIVREAYAHGRQGSEVVLYKIIGGGHTWPGGYQYGPSAVIGETNHALNTSEVIWEFFARHPMDEH